MRMCHQQRYGKANNHYLPASAPNQKLNYIICKDDHNLSTWARSEMLPYKDLKFEANIFILDMLRTLDENCRGYVIEMELDSPRELHDKFKEYPPMPESMAPDAELFSEFQRDLKEKARRNQT